MTEVQPMLNGAAIISQTVIRISNFLHDFSYWEHTMNNIFHCFDPVDELRAAGSLYKSFE